VQNLNEVSLLVADPNEKDYKFRNAELPSNLKEHSYTILDTSDGHVFVNINHASSDSPIGTVYSSDSTGSRFTILLTINTFISRYILSLSHNVRTGDG